MHNHGRPHSPWSMPALGGPPSRHHRKGHPPRAPPTIPKYTISPQPEDHKTTFGKPANHVPQIRKPPSPGKRVLIALYKFWGMCVGRKCCIFWIFLGVWGTLQLVIMAILFKIRSVALVEELLEHKQVEYKNVDRQVDLLADRAFFNCMVAAGIYSMCGIVAYWRIKDIEKREARKPAPEMYLHKYKSYMMYDVGARSDNKIQPRPMYY